MKTSLDFWPGCRANLMMRLSKCDEVAGLVQQSVGVPPVG